MFPSGVAGAGLVVLRASVAATLLFDGTVRWSPIGSPWFFSALVVTSIFLCFGFLTPYCAVVGCLMQLGVMILPSGQDEFHLGISILNGAALAVLGPGAYSIDARIFGRRVLHFPARR